MDKMIKDGYSAEDLKVSKKGNMMYWDEIDGLTEDYVRKLIEYSITDPNVYGYEYTEEDIKEMNDEDRENARYQGVMEVAKEITEFAIRLLEVSYSAEFPVVDENY